MRRIAAVAVFGVLTMTTALPAVADAPERSVVETAQPGTNPCTGDPIFLQDEILFSTHVHPNTTITHARLVGTVGDHETNLATLHELLNKNGFRVSLREMHTTSDGSKFKVTFVVAIKNGSDPTFAEEFRCIRGPRD